MPTSPPASPSTAHRRGRRRDLRRRRARAGRDRLGRRDPRRRPARVRPLRAAVPGPAAGRRRGHPRALADGLLVARRGARERRAADPAGARRRGRRRSAGDAVCRVVASGVNSPLTTSAGRLFDAVAALCGVRATVAHEGQAAAELEGLSSVSERGAYPFEILDDAARAAADPRPAGDDQGAAGRPRRRAPTSRSSAPASTTRSPAPPPRRARGSPRRAALGTVVLSGGVFQNRLLLERTSAALREAGLEVLIPLRLPPNDGGISYGQAAVAAARQT